MKDPMMYVVAIAVVAVFAVVVMLLAKKEGNSLQKILAKVSDENKARLKNCTFTPSDKNGLHFSEALVADVINDGKKSVVELLFYVERLDDFYFRKVTLKPAEAEKRNIRKGNFVKCYMKYDKEMAYYDFKKLA